MSSQSKHPCEISSLKSTSGLLNSFGNWNGCCESLCACLRAGCLGCLRHLPFSSGQTGCARCLRAGCRSPPPSWLTLYIGSAKDEQEDNQPWESRSQNTWVCWQATGRAIAGEAVGCWVSLCCPAALGRSLPWGGGPLGPRASAAAGGGWFSLAFGLKDENGWWPSACPVFATHGCVVCTAARRLEGLAGTCLCSADSWKDQAGFSSILTSIFFFFFLTDLF